jgi:hypothetical protein
MSLRRSARPIVAVLLLTAVLVSTWQWFARSAEDHGTMTGVVRRLVPLEAHIISKCPDTKVCMPSPETGAAVTEDDRPRTDWRPP